MSDVVTVGGGWRAKLVATRLFYAQALAVELIYRFSLVQVFVGMGIGFLGLVFFWLAAGKAATQAAYSGATLIAYFLFAAAHTIVQESRVSWNLSSGIRMGKLAASLLRPYPYLVSVFCLAAAHATIRLFIIAVIFSGIFVFVPSLRDVLMLLGDVWLPYLAVLALSLALGWITRIGIGLLAFDMTQTWGPELVFLSLYAAISGVNYPADLLPDAMHMIVTWTPFYYMVGFPTLVILGRINGPELWLQFGQGACVLVLAALVVWFMWRRGLRKFEAVGI